MYKIILVISTQYPGYGGAATNAYALIQYLRKNGYSAYGIFVEQNRKIDVDPDKIGGILRLDYYPYKYNHIFQIMTHRKILLGIMKKEPDLIICKNYFSPICAKLLYPKIPNIFLISGLDNILDRCNKLSINQIYQENIKISQNSNELKALANTTLAVANSPLTLTIFLNCYSNFKNKIHPQPIDTSQYLVNLDNSTMEKKYDLLITASILTRPEKNNLFLVNFLKDPLLDKYSKIVVGEDNDSFLGIPNCTVVNLLLHHELMKIMKQTKVLLYPSLYDSNPNTIREAVQNKCLILMSNNIGYYEKFPDYSICLTYHYQEWMDKTINLIDNYSQLIDTQQIDFFDNYGLTQLIQKFI